jgi:hypothetical protein
LGIYNKDYLLIPTFEQRSNSDTKRAKTTFHVSAIGFLNAAKDAHGALG